MPNSLNLAHDTTAGPVATSEAACGRFSLNNAQAVHPHLNQLGIPLVHDVGALKDVEILVACRREHLLRETLHVLGGLALLLKPTVVRGRPRRKVTDTLSSGRYDRGGRCGVMW